MKEFIGRLINTLYWISFITLGTLVILLSWAEKPYKYIDDSKSYITCLSNKKTHTYSNVDDYIDKSPNRYELGLYNLKDKANYLCERWIENDLQYRESTVPKVEGNINCYGAECEIYSDYDKKWYPNNQENKKIIIANVKNKFPDGLYKIDNVYSTRGSWYSVATWLIFGTTGLYIGLNIIKETLLYLFLGEKFSFDWLKKIIIFLTKKDNE